MPALSQDEIQQALRAVPEWQVTDGALRRTFQFTDFRESMSFVNLVAALAERAQHHPDIDIRYNLVRLALVSHDAGGITERDARMARQLSAAFPTSAA